MGAFGKQDGLVTIMGFSTSMLHLQGTFFLLEKLKLTVLRRLLMRCCILHLEANAADANPHHFPLGKPPPHSPLNSPTPETTVRAHGSLLDCLLCYVQQCGLQLN